MSTSAKGKKTTSKFSRLHFIAFAQIGGLSLLLVFTFFSDQRHSMENIRKLAEGTARTYAQKDTSYRELFIASGGAYITVSQEVIPEESLAHRPDRDLQTPAGKVVTLMTPKNLLHLASARLPVNQGLEVLSGIKTLVPLSQEDTPDAWEMEALLGLQHGRADVSAVVRKDDLQVLRFMYPILATKGCVQNRPGQDLKEGDLLGGLSIMVPMALYTPLQKKHAFNSFSLHFILWALGATGIFWSFRKIQKRDVKILAAQAAQKNAYEELEKTFDAIDGIITIQDRNMRITRVNRATCATFNAQAEDLVGKYCYEIFRGADKACDGCPEIETLQDGISRHSEIVHKNLKKTFSVAAVPITNGDGETTGLVHYAKDITESRRQEEQLRQAQKMEAVGTLAGGIAHDFNNILTAIIGFSELAMLRPGADPAISKDLSEVNQAGLRAKELVKQILTFSRQNEQDFQALQIQPVVKEALKLLRASIPTTITFALDLAAEDAVVVADPSQVHQVVMNLCTNAYHAMCDSGGTLTVSLQRVELKGQDVRNGPGLNAGPALCLVVGDTGKGINKQDQERIFEPYFTTKKKGEGTGLGLSLVHGIVSSMGGAIAVDSAEGKGTTFLVYLPVVAASEVDTKGEAESSRPMPTGSEHILIVDDEENILAMERRMLESLGYTVTSFSDAVQAKEAFAGKAETFDLVITDMNMPLLSGLDLVKFLKEARHDIPIVMSTGFSERINSKTSREHGLKKVVMKPIVFHELAHIVRNALDD